MKHRPSESRPFVPFGIDIQKETDYHLVEALSSDQAEVAWTEIVRRFKPKLTQLIQSYTHDTQATEEILSIVWEKARKSVTETSVDPAAFSSWLNKVAKTRTLNWLRDEKRARGHLVDDFSGGLALSSEPSEEATPEEVVMAHDVFRLTRKELATLDPKQRGIFMAYVDGTPVEIIARTFDTNPNNVHKIIFRTRQRLRQSLEEHDL